MTLRAASRWLPVLLLLGCGDPRPRQVLGEIEVDPASLDFGVISAGTTAQRTVAVKNRGAGGLSIGAPSLGGVDVTQFSFAPLAGAELASGASIELTVRYAPTAIGVHSARLVITSNAANASELLVGLVGNAVTASACDASTCLTPPGPCFEPQGTCANGACSYVAKAAGASCDDANACTVRDACDGLGGCGGAALVCQEPPPPACQDPHTQRTWGAGSCLGDGGCGYTAQDSSCALGCDADAGSCRQSCGAGSHDCSGQCVSSASTATCGTRCVACPTVDGGVATCDGTSCGLQCDPGFRECAATCAACPSGAGVATTQCSGSTCVADTCAAGYQLCGGQCRQTGPAACGPSCTVCPAPPANATASCTTGACGFVCNAGFANLAGACVPCDVSVPAQQPTISAAILNAPSPGTVCVAAGTWAENLTLRPHVSVRGVGPATILNGMILAGNLAHADPTPTVVSDLTVSWGGQTAISMCPASTPTNCGLLQLTSPFSLTLERLRFDQNPTGSTTYIGYFELAPTGAAATLTLRDSVLQSTYGLRVVSWFGWYVAGTGGSLTLVVERNRFLGAPGVDWIANAIDYLPNCSAATCPAGTTVNALIQNNEFLAAKTDAVYTTQALTLTAADRPNSATRLINNTIVCDAPTEYAFWNNSLPGKDPSMTVANNLAWNCHSQLVRGQAPNVLASNQQPSVSPFVSISTSDLHLAAGSAPIDAASAVHAPSNDKAGLSRPVDGNGNGTAEPDVGAHEYRP